jgi:ParB-like chromosome segregation protein Spo0J
MSSDANPLGLTVIDDVTGFVPAHAVTDPAKADKLAADMDAHGWQGAPIVVHRDYAQALTGVHRLAAADRAGIAVPGVDIEELLEACGLDLWAVREEQGGELEDAIRVLIDQLPTHVRDAYGLDLH